MNTKIFIDMDGTLYRFHDEILYDGEVQLEKMYEENFFKRLKPFSRMIDAVNELHDNLKYEIYFISAVNEKDIELQKLFVLKRDFPWIDDEHCLFPFCGSNKGEFVEYYFEHELTPNDILIDDYNKNLEDWSKRNGSSIKFVNNINHKGKGKYGGDVGNIWNHDLIRYDSDCIVKDIIKIIEGKNINKRYR